MRYKDRIDFTFSAEDAVAVNGALNTLEEKLPFLIALTKTDIRRMTGFIPVWDTSGFAVLSLGA